VEQNIFHFATLLSSCEKSTAWSSAAHMLHQAGAVAATAVNASEDAWVKKGDVT